MFNPVANTITSRYSHRQAKISQLGELYVSTSMSSLAKSLVGIFIPVYLYRYGYTVADIAAFYTVVFGARIIVDNVVGWLVGEYGPKHLMILGNMFLVLNLYILATLDSHHWSLLLIALTQVFSTSPFFVAYHVAFSKIHSSASGGRQIGNMFKLIKMASAAGPIIGGLAASVFGLSSVLYVSMAIVVLSVAPLLLSPEPVRAHQHIYTRNFPWRMIRFDVLSNVGLAADQLVSMVVWPLFIAIYIFTDKVYLGVGVVTSVGLVVSVLLISLYGRMIDSGKGARLLNAAVTMQSAMHLLRLLVGSPSLVLATNMIGEPLSSGVRMPYVKGVYDAASSYEGYRIVYLCAILTSTNIARTLIMLGVWLIAGAGYQQISLQMVFVMASLSVWLVTMQRYKGLSSGQKNV